MQLQRNHNNEIDAARALREHPRIGRFGATGARKMDAATLEALQRSIEAWEGIVAGTAVADEQSSNPALCAMFVKDHCEGCPVRERTGDSLCYGSPHEDYDLAVEVGDEPSKARYARAEVEFLKSLLPSEDQYSEFSIERLWAVAFDTLDQLAVSGKANRHHEVLITVLRELSARTQEKQKA
jgi:hypothetical protein